MREIYLDNAATTCVYPKVVKAMKSAFSKNFGNPSSLHVKGEQAFKEINEARKKIAAEIESKPHEIVFTSGGTESNNLAIQGIARANKDKKKNKIIISAIEHASVVETCEFLKKEGYKIARIPVDESGFVDLEFLEREADKKTLLVCVMHANNIFGTIQNLREIGRICSKKDVLFHSDCVQSFGKLKINVNDWGIDLLSASGHKIGGAKGAGFLYVRDGINVSPLIFGGGQEKGLRSGTENVPAIIGFEKALEICKKVNWIKVGNVRNLLISELEKIGGKINGTRGENRIWGNVHVSFPGVDAEKLIYELSQKGIYVSAGSACESKKKREDYVLRAIGLDKKEISGSIRLTLNEENGERDVRRVVGEVEEFIGNK